MGLFFASSGFSAAVLVARVWETVAQEAHCVPACPSFASQALRLHHLYYGLGLLLPSPGTLLLARRQRVRWDLSLILGIGAGLFADEVGLLFLRVPYSHPLSLLVLAMLGGALFFGTVHAAFRDGTREFRLLDRADFLTVLSILLAMGGVLYLDRPVMAPVQASGVLSGSLALLLLALYAKTHFMRTLKGPG